MADARPRPGAFAATNVVVVVAALTPLLLPDPARAGDNVFFDLVVGPSGYLTGGTDDRYRVRRDFLNSSTRATDWSTSQAELVFESGTAHLFTLTGEDRGPVGEGGLVDNFAWGTLRLRSGQTLELEDGNAALGGAQYVTRLVLEDGVAQLSSITGNGMKLYYDLRAPENAYLAGGTYVLAGGGLVAPFPVAKAPALSGPGRALAGALLLLVGAATLAREARRESC